jgi:outer membrane protein assembly factor BamB
VRTCAAGRLLIAILTPCSLCWAAQKSATTQPAASAPATLRATATEWPIWRGDGRLTGVAACELPEKLAVRWTFEAAEAIESSPAISGGGVFVGSDDGHLYAIDLATGELRWKFDTSAKPDQPMMVRGSPTVHRGAVYVGNDDGTLFALGAADGKERWRFRAEAEIISAANIVGDSLVFGAYDDVVRCLSLDGKLKWEYATEGRVHATPAIADGRVLVAGCDGMLRAIDLRSGRQVEQVELGAYAGASPATAGSACYIGTFGERVVAADWKAGRLLWHYEHETRKFPYLSSAAVTDRAVFIGGRDKYLRALDRATGRLLWEHRTGARVEGSPVVSGGRVYIGSGDGRVYGLDAASGRVAWEFDTGAPILASPAVADGCLVVGNEDGVVFCFAGDDEGIR